MRVVVRSALLNTVESVANGMTVRVSITYTSGGMDVDPVNWLLVMSSVLEIEPLFNANVSGQVTRLPEQLGWVFIVTIGYK
jgi:hypothetical protein